MGDFGQIAQDRHRIGPVGILRTQLGQRGCGLAFEDVIEQVHDAATIGQPQHGAHLLGGCFTCTVADRLIQQ